MSRSQSLLDPTAFDEGWWLDWCDDPTGNANGTGAPKKGRKPSNIYMQRVSPMDARTRVSGLPGFYDLVDTAVTVNQSGQPDAFVEYCANTNILCNFCFGDPVLFAEDPDSSGFPNAAPIQLTFSRPLRAVGAYVAGIGDNVMGVAFSAILWVRIGGRWEPPVANGGRMGPVQPADGVPTAPFVGAAATGSAGITEACFDVARFANFRFSSICISELYGIG